MKIVNFIAEAKRLSATPEQISQTYEKDLKNGRILGVISPKKTELIAYEPAELQAIITELSSGKISLANLSQQLNLSTYQVHTVLQHLVKTGKINGELTYNTFIARSAFKMEMLQKSKAHKREHRLSIRNRQH